MQIKNKKSQKETDNIGWCLPGGSTYKTTAVSINFGYVYFGLFD